jgi:hypothetical protein
LSDLGSNRIGLILAGLLFMALGIFLFAPLPSDGEWTWGSYIGSTLFGFLIGIPVFILGSWVFISGLRSQPRTSQVSNVPLVDEWIGEYGKEEIEIVECKRMLKTDEKLLALVAVREEQGPNRLATTDKRVMIYPQGNIENLVSYDYGQIEAVRGKRNTPLVHLGEIILSVKGNNVILKNVGMEYVDQIVELITRMKR